MKREIMYLYMHSSAASVLGAADPHVDTQKHRRKPPTKKRELRFLSPGEILGLGALDEIPGSVSAAR